MGKEEETPWASTICCGVIIINFVVLRCRNTLYVKIAILLIIGCRADLAGSKEWGKEEKLSYKWDLVLPWGTAATGQ